MLEQRAQQRELLGTEVAFVVFQGHGKNSFDVQAEFQRRLGDEQVGALGHAHDNVYFGVGQKSLELEDKRSDCLANTGNPLRVQFAVAGHPDHERGAAVDFRVGQVVVLGCSWAPRSPIVRGRGLGSQRPP